MYPRRKVSAIIEVKTMIFPTDKRSMCKLFLINRNVLSLQSTITNYKINRELSYFQLVKDTSISKNLILATVSQVDNLPSKMFICSDHLEKMP